MTGQRSYSMSNAIVNNNLVFQMGMDSTELVAEFSKYANEFVAYAIIENAYRSIESGALIPYTLDLHHAANYVANPRVGNSFTQSVNSKDNVVS